MSTEVTFNGNLSGAASEVAEVGGLVTAPYGSLLTMGDTLSTLRTWPLTWDGNLLLNPVAPYEFDGTVWNRRRQGNRQNSFNALAIAAETTIWTPAAGKKFRLLAWHLISSVAGNIILRDGTAGPIIFIVPSGAGGSGVFVVISGGKLSATANNLLTAQGPAASTLSGFTWGTEE